jgi:murein DD-endopeptidase MepM/ murein hydrolase activator NlpD
LYWWLILLSFLPLLPMPSLFQHWTIPSVLLQDTVRNMQAMAALPLHPGLVEGAPDPGRYWQAVLGLVMLISALQCGRLAMQWRQLQRLINQGKPLDNSLLLTASQMQLIEGYGQRVEIRQTQAAISPFIAGWQRMTLVVPAYIWQLSVTQRQLLLSHELTHLKRRDPQQLLLLRLLVALFWFMPSMRALEAAFIRSMELAVDREVLARQPQHAALYGQTLLTSLKLARLDNPSQLMPGFIRAGTDQGFYRQRLQQLFQPVLALSALQRGGALVLLGGATLLLNLGCAQLSFSTPPQEWHLPVGKVPINSFYGEQHPFRLNRPHQGLDFGAKQGARVEAAQKGTVLIADASSLHSRYGKVVLIDHGAGYQTLYAHLDDFSVSPGARVEAGQQIGKVGATGKVTGPHLHFELLLQGKQQDPAPYLNL